MCQVYFIFNHQTDGYRLVCPINFYIFILIIKSKDKMVCNYLIFIKSSELL